VLGGTPAKTYAIALHVRGVVEQKTINGATPGGATGTNGGFFVIGGNPAGDSWNLYRLDLAKPALTTFLNSGNSGHDYCDGIDYRVTLHAAAGSGVTLSGSSSDQAEAKNRTQAGAAITIAGVAGANPFNGQFVQIDVEHVDLLP
jgi:hypothetical protein